MHRLARRILRAKERREFSSVNSASMGVTVESIPVVWSDGTPVKVGDIDEELRLQYDKTKNVYIMES